MPSAEIKRSITVASLSWPASIIKRGNAIRPDSWTVCTTSMGVSKTFPLGICRHTTSCGWDATCSELSRAKTSTSVVNAMPVMASVTRSASAPMVSVRSEPVEYAPRSSSAIRLYRQISSSALGRDTGVVLMVASLQKVVLNYLFRRHQRRFVRSFSRSSRTLCPIALMMFSAASRTAAAEPSSSPGGSSGADVGTTLPRVQPASMSRRSNLSQFAGQRHGASGAKSRLHLRTTSSPAYVLLS